jgi:hypothetical protein
MLDKEALKRSIRNFNNAVDIYRLSLVGSRIFSVEFKRVIMNLAKTRGLEVTDCVVTMNPRDSSAATFVLVVPRYLQLLFDEVGCDTKSDPWEQLRKIFEED